MTSKIFSRFPVSHSSFLRATCCKSTFPPFLRRTGYSLDHLHSAHSFNLFSHCKGSVKSKYSKCTIAKDYHRQNVGLIHCCNLHRSPLLRKDGKDLKANISYRIVPKEKPEILTKFLMNNYHKQEPITVALGMPMSEVHGWFKRFIRRSLWSSICDVSVQAVDEDSNRTAGVLASVLVSSYSSKPTEADFTNPEFHPVNKQMEEFLDGLRAAVDPVKAAGIKVEGKPPSILVHLFLSVHHDFLKQGISNEMIKVSESVASNIYNCRVGHVTATSEFSYLAFLKNGYKVVNEINYADYVDSKGQKLFADKLDKLKPHTKCRIMVKQLKCLYSDE